MIGELLRNDFNYCYKSCLVIMGISIVAVASILTLPTEAYSDTNNPRISALDIINGNIERIKGDIEKGANIDDPISSDGKTPLMIAAASAKNLDVLKFLLEKGANVNITTKNSGHTALSLAASRNRYEAVKLLIKYGADVNARDNKYQFDALGWAARKNHVKIAELLISKGANVNASSKQGYTPLHLAAYNKCPEMVNLCPSRNG